MSEDDDPVRGMIHHGIVILTAAGYLCRDSLFCDAEEGRTEVAVTKGDTADSAEILESRLTEELHPLVHDEDDHLMTLSDGGVRQAQDVLKVSVRVHQDSKFHGLPPEVYGTTIPQNVTLLFIKDTILGRQVC